ncbi:MAG: ATP-binding protein [Galbitalea sp.]
MSDLAFSRFAHLIGYICLAGAALDLIGYQAAAPGRLLWPALIPLAFTLAALVLLDHRRGVLYTALFLAVGGLALYWFAVTLLSQVPSARESDFSALTLIKVALIFVAGVGFASRLSILWCCLAFAIGEAASIGAALQTHSAIHGDFVSISAAIGLVAVEVTSALARRRRDVRPDLDRAAIDEELSAVRSRIELRAATLMHDMVLNHLAAIATARDASLRPELKQQIEKDLEILIGEEWLREPSPEADARARIEWRRSSVLAAVREARELSLSVEVTGDLGAIGRLTEERDIAVGLAVKQCLVNVLNHAKVERAEVVVIGSEADVTVMVIDAGQGFSEERVAADRLGLRRSVYGRIESVGGDVQLWSTPGRGTSVMIRVPAIARVDRSDG